MEELELAQTIVREATKLGAQFADAFVLRGRSIGVEAESGSIRSTEAGETDSVSVRAFVKGARGTASVDGFAAIGASPLQLAREAVDIAKSADPDPDFKSLPAFEPADDLDGLYDPALESFPPSQAVKIVGDAIDAARAVDSSATVMADVSISAGAAAVANSLGVAVARKSSSIDHGVFVVIRRGDDVGSFYDFDAGRMLSDVDLAPVGASAARAALQFLGARKIQTRPMPVVLGPLAAYSFIKALANAANAESIQRNRSYLVDKLGRKIGSDAVTIVDNGLVPHGLASGTHDGEGARRREVTIFDAGLFAAMLHNSYTANKASAPNTGHATRGGGISASNAFLRLGSRTASEIISGVSDGLYIHIGGLAINSSSGDISTSVDFGYKIENGQLAYPIANAMVAGNIFDVLAAVDAVSSDYRSEPGAIMPTVLIGRMDVSGG